MSNEIQRIQIPDSCDHIALCGGPYSNFGAVEAFLGATESCDYRFCLGDIGGFGPLPNRTIEQLRDNGVICLQGNYDHAVGYGERDCGCGYSDAGDRHFAQISYDYTYAHTDGQHRDWMRSLPRLIRLEWRDRAFLLCHGSPVQVNEFVWESETGDAQIQAYLEQFQVDAICGTHTGIPWLRHVDRPTHGRGFWLNVGVLGRPAHEGKPHVYYSRIDFHADDAEPSPQLLPLVYDVASVIEVMQQEGLPQEFQQSLKQGVWTTCASVLPRAEQSIQVRI
ncbi:MAG: hypothetical protein WBA57_01900 [Elainellaceae cyanobacterium]